MNASMGSNAEDVKVLGSAEKDRSSVTFDRRKEASDLKAKC
jgi:hypothetical protein